MLLDTPFYRKQVCIKMRKHTETFHANKSYTLPIFYTNFSVFKTEICGTLFNNRLHENSTLHTPTFHMKMNHSTHCP